MSRIMAAVNEPRPKFTEVRGVSLGGEVPGQPDMGTSHCGQDLRFPAFGIQERKLSWHAEAGFIEFPS